MFVVAHDPDLGGDPVRTLDWPSVQSRAPEVLRLEQLLAALAVTGMGAHVDVKFETSGSARKSGESWEADLLDALTDALPSRADRDDDRPPQRHPRDARRGRWNAVRGCSSG